MEARSCKEKKKIDKLYKNTKVPTNHYFHYLFICRLFSLLIVWSIKHQNTVKNAHCNCSLQVTSSNDLFCQTTSLNPIDTLYTLKQKGKAANCHVRT